MKKNDWILIGCVIVIAVGFLGFRLVTGRSGKEQVVIKADGQIFGTYSLMEEQEIDIDGMNLLVIKEGQAAMKQADCPDQLCVHQKAIDRDGESIICLPNKVVITVESNRSSELDAVTN